MRIAIFSWESMHSINVGGVAFHVTELACALERKGNEVHLFTRLGDKDQPGYELIHGVHYHRCPYGSDANFVQEIENMCDAFTKVFFETEDHIGKFDVIHAHDWLTAYVLPWIRETRPRKSVFTIHSTEYGRCGNNFPNGNSEKIRHIEWLGSYHADEVVAVSRTLKRELESIYNVPEWKVNTIYNGITYSDYDGWVDAGNIKSRYGIASMDPTVLFVGRMAYQKGPDILVDAIGDILRYHDNAKFVFVGDGEMRWSVEDRARELGVSHATRFLGHTNGIKLKDLFKACDCVCVPSRNEPFGIVILEAWSAGKPVIASINGGPSEIIWHDVNGYKIYAEPKSVAWGIGTLFSDFDHAKYMGRNGRIAVETVFSWDVIADEMLALYSH
ncbi:glycosyltransferase family 4 protein [Candidatus Omnitrophota bacterium]